MKRVILGNLYASLLLSQDKQNNKFSVQNK
ncbi:hypothetical protein O23A_p1067 [Aeromonas salmonicida]|nr:hypothetical protein O23A_p1067 [Aeromonas salmonicida]